jgi:uncharacterized protein (UPF0276 family)
MDAAAVGPLPTGDWVRAPALGTTYQPRHPLLTEATLPFLDVLEVSPDSLVESTDGPVLGGQALEELRHLSTDVAIVAHGVGLSLASYDSWWDGYLRCLDQLASAVPLQWHSEHLGYTRVNGEFFGTMLIENVVGLLPDYPSQYSQAGFLNRIVEATGCGLLLDVYNLRCDEANRGLVIEEFLDELQLEAVVEVHVAGGVEYLGFTLDVHSRAPLLTTLELARQVITRCPNLRLVTYELMEEAVTPLGAPAIVNSLRMTRAIALSGHRRGVGPRRSTGRVSAVR